MELPDKQLIQLCDRMMDDEEVLREERDRYRDALVRLYHAARGVQVFINSRERIEQTTGKKWFEDELSAAFGVIKGNA